MLRENIFKVNYYTITKYKIIFLFLFIIQYSTNTLCQDSIWFWTYPSASNVIVDVKADVGKNIIGYTYSYHLKNQINSQQNIESFFLDYNSNIIIVNSPINWFSLFSDTRRSIMWFAEDSLSFIFPSQELLGYRFSSQGIPAIATFYVRGFRNVQGFKYGNTPDVVIGGNIFENSFKGRTIAPANAPSHFNSIHFLDTIKSYVTQSLSLGWIANQTTANKYLAFFDSAKVQIQQNRNYTARYTLDTVLAHVNRDSSGLLSSEAYALIRFNTEYLIDNMPGTITISSSVSSRWNMVSIPNYTQNFSDSAIFPYMQSPLYTYDAGYVVKKTLTNGPGYWIKMDSNRTVTYTGMKIDSIKIPVKSGWNMVGSVSSAFHHSKVRADSTTSLTSIFYGYSTQGYTVDTILQPGRGYWIKVNGNGNLTLNSNYSVSGTYPNFNEQPTAQAPGTPDKPVLQLPANGATNISITPTLSWIEVHSAERYHLQVSTNINFTCLLINDANITTDTVRIGPLYGGITYYWRVSATNTNGTSYWSNVRNFKTRGKTLFEPCPDVDMLSALDQFSVSDAENNRQTLYVRNGGRLISKKLIYAEELPPPTIRRNI